MAREKQTDIQAYWEARIEKAKKVKKKWEDDFQVDNLDKLYEGFQRPSEWKNDQWITINLVFANMRTQLPVLFSQNPEIRCTLKSTFSPVSENMSPIQREKIREFYELQTKLRSAAINYYFDILDIKDTIRYCVLDAYPAFGVAKIWYVPSFEQNSKAGQPLSDKEGNPVHDEAGNQIFEPEEVLVSEKWAVERINPKDIVMDDTMIAERMVYSLGELKTNSLFKNTHNIQPNTKIQEDKKDEHDRKVGENGKQEKIVQGSSRWFSKFKNREEQEMPVLCWQIWDLDQKKFIVIAEGHDKPIRGPKLIPAGVLKHPYVFLQFNRRRNAHYPIPELFPMLDTQKEYNITRNQIMLHRKRFNRKYLLQKNMMTSDERAKIEDPYDGVIAETKASPIGVLEPIKDAPLDQAVYFDTNMLRQDFLDIAGVAPDREVLKAEKATTAQLYESRRKIREYDKVGIVAEFVEKIAEKLMYSIEENITIETAIKFMGPKGQDWITINKKNLDARYGQFKYRVNVQTMTPNDIDTERNHMDRFMQLIAAAPYIALSKKLMKKYAELYRIQDESIIEELEAMAQKLLQSGNMQSGMGSMPAKT
jgi:hypothetical protein